MHVNVPHVCLVPKDVKREWQDSLKLEFQMALKHHECWKLKPDRSYLSSLKVALLPSKIGYGWLKLSLEHISCLKSPMCVEEKSQYLIYGRTLHEAVHTRLLSESSLALFGISSVGSCANPFSSQFPL